MDAVLGVIFAVGFVIFIFGYDYYMRRQEADHVTSVKEVWRGQRREIRAEPVATDFYGSEPLNSHANLWRKFGALGVVDDALVLVFKDGRRDLVVQGDEIRWFGQRMITVKNGKYSTQKNALMVHYEQNGRWYVGAFVPQRESQLMRALTAISGLEPVRTFGQREDYGPIQALRLHQDVYGQWHPDEADVVRIALEDGEMALPPQYLRGTLYLAPDRLLYKRRDGIQLEWLRRVDVYEKGGLHKLNPFSEDLMRIEYQVGDRHHVIGFLLRHGERWGPELGLRAGVPAHVHEGGRKKKVD